MRRRIPSLNALRAFEAAGRLGLMKLAAAELCVTHGAISRQVSHLEEWLGVALFAGPKHAPRLTEAGSALLPALTTAFDQLGQAVGRIADTDEGPLDVSCPGTFTMRWLIPRLHHFNATHPHVDVRLNSSGTSSDPLRDNVDVAIRVGCAPWPQGVDVIYLFNEKFGPVHAPSIALLPGKSWHVPLLHTVSRRGAWSDWSARSGIDADGEGSAEFEHFYFMLEAAIAGLGVSVSPWPLVAEDVTSGRLIAPCGFIESGLNYVALRRRKQNRKATLFCDWLKTAAEEYRASDRSSPPESI
ncbi:LysR substrate-binding domain-containing protein [Acerihabitans arboris]|uniref:LysR family transcriptional regulator n=1 Tax=Acerihabitans arboris TaxID=2691583 RepID=A0A845SGG3_9GAMM|nr:LysR substrate-binding domain-containing protein [Acerihabitans arboris]NDL62959.1 LysR family transcriptional regulator [Acerihabitans arboris]